MFASPAIGDSCIVGLPWPTGMIDLLNSHTIEC